MNLNELWDEFVMDALASDGPIRDSDVKDAVRRWRPKIESAALLGAEWFPDELRAHRYGEDTEGVHGAWCACGEWDDAGKEDWAEHAAKAIRETARSIYGSV